MTKPLITTNNCHFNRIAALIPPLFFISVAAFFCYFILPEEQALFIDRGFDSILLLIIAIILFFRCENGGLKVLIVTVSYEMHLYSVGQLGSFAVLYQLSWLICAGYLLWKPQSHAPVIAYHLGLNFDAAMMRTTGLGMQTSLYCSSAIILLLAGLFGNLQRSTAFSFDKRHLLLFPMGLAMVSRQFTGNPAYYSNEIVMLIASLALFWSTLASDDREEVIWGLAAGGMLIALVSLANVALMAESLPEILRRRAYAAGAHPNKIATWAFACQWLLHLLNADQSKMKLHLIRSLQIILWLVIIMTGARLILALALISHLLLFGQHLMHDRRFKFAAFLVVLLSFLRFAQKFTWAELLRNERLMIWYSAWSNISENIWTGLGALPMAFLPQKFQSGSAFWLYDWNYPHAHQLFLELMLWGGVLSLAAFIFIFVTAWRKAGERTTILALFSLLATGFFDFAWGTPAMLAIALFMLTFPFRTHLSTNSRIAVRYALIPVFLLMAAAIIGATNWLHTVSIYEKSGQAFATGRGNWQELGDYATKRLSEPLPAMHMILRRSAARAELDQLCDSTRHLLEKSPRYYALWFMLGRFNELAGKHQAALDCYHRSISLEPRDLTGIRHARALLMQMKTNNELSSELAAEVYKRGGWGQAILLQHPQFGQRLRENLEIAGGQMIAAAPVVEKLFFCRNTAEWGSHSREMAPDLLKDPQLPYWMKDELKAALLLADSQNFENNAILAFFSNNSHEFSAAATWRALGKIADASGLHNQVLLAYERHRQSFNFRGKNFEDLKMQYYAARGFSALKQFAAAKNEVERIMAFDHGNPFVFALMGDIEAAAQNPVQAKHHYEQALLFCRRARFLPHFNHEPDDDNWPEGDHWSMVIERSLRFRDRESLDYNLEKWDSFEAEIREKIAGLKL